MAWSKKPVNYLKTATELQIDAAPGTSVNVLYTEKGVGVGSMPSYLRLALAYELARQAAYTIRGFSGEAQKLLEEVSGAELQKAIITEMQNNPQFYSGSSVPITSALRSVSDVVAPNSLLWGRLYAYLADRYDDLLEAFLASYPWSFAIARAPLSLAETPSLEFTYAGSLPSDCLYVLYASKANYDDKLIPYAVEQGKIQAFDNGVTITYVRKDVSYEGMSGVVKEAFLSTLAQEAAGFFNQADVEDQSDQVQVSAQASILGRAQRRTVAAYQVAREHERQVAPKLRFSSEVVSQALILLGYNPAVSALEYVQELYLVLNRFEQSRDFVLREFPWSFARKRANLKTTPQTSGTLVAGQRYYISTYESGDDFTNVGASSNAAGVSFVATGEAPTVWTFGSALIPRAQAELKYEHTLPCECLFLLAVVSDETFSQELRYSLESDRQVLCDDSDIWVLYTARVLDEGQFTPGFVETLAHYIAWSVARLLYPKDTNLQDSIYARYLDVFARAKETEAREMSGAQRYLEQHRRGSAVAVDSHQTATNAQYGDDWYENARLHNPALSD